MNNRNLKRKYGYSYVNTRAYHAIVVYADPATGELRFAKYHNIQRNDTRLRSFFQFARDKFGQVQYVNLYDPGRPKGDNFVRRETDFFK